MKRIIVPFDFSTLAINGLKLSILLAREIDAIIDLVHVVLPQNETGNNQVYSHHDLMKKMEETAVTYEKENEGIKIECKVKTGKIYEEIVYEAEKHKDSMIVASTHGESGWEEFFIGKNAYKIVSSSIRPVFTIRGSQVPTQIRKIVLPIDITLESREKTPFTALLAKETGAKVYVVTVATSDMSGIKEKLDGYVKQVLDYLNKYNIENSLDNLIGNNITDITIDYAKNIKADLISIMSEQEHNVANILLGNYAHQMINKSPVPVLIIPSRHIGTISEGFRAEGINY